jgi:WD40 repeat protein
VRAGLAASRPEGWAAVVCTPAAAPFRALGQALVPELAGDVEALQRMLSFDDPGVAFEVVSRWRKGHGAALLVVDQLEELFALNAAETQERFATLLGRLSSEAGVHVLLSLRDDFLMKCADFGALAGVFESLSPLPALSREGLARALVEPAKGRGYRFEDEALVGEMVASVEGTRAALPLLAFAVARLWERRDRDRKLLTRRSYEEIGGVAGALAQHAEATMDRVGAARQGIVREVFRNLVTAQGTRAALEREEVMSLFPAPKAAEEVVGELIDARLLTTYEVEGREGEPSHHRVEVVHESLLKAWPRLVRWQAQDEEGAVLRDQLRQAAHLWQDKGRTGDLLWAGTALQEFELWRGRYQGALTTLEEDFARAMREKARRRKRLVTAALASVIVTLAGVAVAIGLSREQAARARDAAKAEALRAESAKLLALAQLRLADDPTEALAFTTASLELADTKEARAFVMRALWEAPPALEMPTAPLLTNPAFSLDGQRLALGGFSDVVAVWKDDGSLEARLAGHEQEIAGPYATWTSTGLLVTQINGPTGRRARVWSFPGGRLVRTIEHAPGFCCAMGEQLVCNVEGSPSRPNGTARLLLAWRLPDGDPEELGRLDPKLVGAADYTWTARGWVYAKGRQLFLRPPPAWRQTGDRCFGRHDADVVAVGWWLPGLDWVFSSDKAGQYRVWAPRGGGFVLRRMFQRPDSAPTGVVPDMTLRWLSEQATDQARARLWDLAALPGARPLSLRRAGSWYAAVLAVHPRGDWLVTVRMSDQRADFWPLRKTYPAVVDGCNAVRRALAFTPDGRWLATICGPAVAKAIHLWPLPGPGPDAIRKLEFPQEVPLLNLSIEGQGRYVFGAGWNRAAIAPLDGSAPRVFALSESTLHYSAAVSPSGRRVATAFAFGAGERTLRVWDVETGAMKSFALPASASTSAGGQRTVTASGYDRGVLSASFVDDSTLYTAGDGGLRRWDLGSGTSRVVAATPGQLMTMAAADGRRAVTQLVPKTGDKKPCAPIELRDPASGAAQPLPAFGDCVKGFAISADGEVVAAGSMDGTVRVGRLSGEPHLLLGHDRAVTNVAISPDARWVATAGEDNTLRLWPMPDLDEPPLHTLPREELIAELHSLTNLRAVRDTVSPTGWRIEVGPFPGWRDVPTW